MQLPAVLKVQHLSIIFLQFLFWASLRGLLDSAPEVAYFGNIVLDHKNIQSFNIPMNYSILVQIAYAEANVYENLPDHIFVKSFSQVILFLNKFVNISIRTELEYNIDLLVLNKTIVVPDHVRWVQGLHSFYFFQGLDTHLFRHYCYIYHFYNVKLIF